MTARILLHESVDLGDCDACGGEGECVPAYHRVRLGIGARWLCEAHFRQLIAECSTLAHEALGIRGVAAAVASRKPFRRESWPAGHLVLWRRTRDLLGKWVDGKWVDHLVLYREGMATRDLVSDWAPTPEDLVALDYVITEKAEACQ